jgi:hypothetical protein
MAKRGDIRQPRFARRRRTFSGLTYDNITPGDIDLSIDFFWGKLFIFVEGKTSGTQIPDGQRWHLGFLVQAIRRGDREAFAAIIEYSDGGDEVDYAECLISEFTADGKHWRPTTRPVKLKEFVDYVHEFSRWRRAPD